ncbi:DUF2750 domain-containing protein [Solicola sp. PLA-1-18]|uniref:DUF2750 domain-containing protein n=1 Tax=Solicola sp. PLA-1-18 TaxID=3380532 RepID=UPI003B7DD7BC
MSTAAANTSNFYTEALRHGQVWAVRDEGGIPAPVRRDGARRVMPFWSTHTRAHRIVETVDAYAGMVPFAIPLDVWRTRWLTGLDEDEMDVGLNWAGPWATGYDLSPEHVRVALASRESRASAT